MLKLILKKSLSIDITPMLSATALFACDLQHNTKTSSTAVYKQASTVEKESDKTFDKKKRLNLVAWTLSGF